MKIKEILFYTIKCWGMLIFLYLVSVVSHSFPTYLVIIVCFILAYPGIQSLIYLNVIRKTSWQRRYVEVGFLSWINNGKIICIITSYIVSFLTAFFVFLEIPAWEPSIWIAIGIPIPIVFYLFFLVIGDFLSKEVKGFYLDYYKVLWCLIITPVFFTIIYFGIEYVFIPLPEYKNIEDALLYHQYRNALNKSSSSLIKEFVKLTSMYDAFQDYLFSAASKKIFSMFNSIWNIFFNAAIFFYITNILVFFTIPKEQLKRNFRPLSPNELLDNGTPMQKKYIIILASLMALTMALFIVLDIYFPKLKEEGYFMFIEHFEVKIKSFRAL